MASSVFAVLFIVFAGTAYGALTHTNSFKNHLLSLEGELSKLTSCLSRVSHPLGAASEFSKEIVQIEGLITHLDTRLSTMIRLMNVVMAIPFVGTAAAVVLGPVETVINAIDQGIKTVNNQIAHYVGIIKGWLKPLEIIQHAVDYLNGKMNLVVGIMSKVSTEIQKIETCVTGLPAGHLRSTAETAMEHVSTTVDHVPRALISPVTHVEQGCAKVQGFLSKFGIVRKRGLPVLSQIISVLTKILKAMGPVGKFLDKVDAELNKKICLVGDLIKVGGKVVSKVESTIKDIGHSISHHFHHIFGRKRGVDICLSVNDILKGIQGVTAELLSQAKKMITGLFHGHLPFHIPGLTGDVLNLGSTISKFTGGIPSVLMSIAEPLIVNALHLNTNQYVQAIPACVAAIKG